MGCRQTNHKLVVSVCLQPIDAYIPRVTMVYRTNSPCRQHVDVVLLWSPRVLRGSATTHIKAVQEPIPEGSELHTGFGQKPYACALFIIDELGHATWSPVSRLGTTPFWRNRHIIFRALVALEPLLSLMSRFGLVPVARE